MRILIDARPGYGGIQRYALNLVAQLSNDLTADTLIGWGHDPEHDPGQVRHRWALRSTLGDFRRVLTDQYLLPRATCRHGAELLHSIRHFLPQRLNRPCVLTCHDLWLLDHPEQKSGGWVTHYEYRQLEQAVLRANHIIAVSDSVAASLTARFDLNQQEISVIYPPLGLRTASSARSALPPAVSPPYLLSVGTLEPRKNLDRLIDAQLLAWRESRIPLLLVGPPGWKHEQILKRIEASSGAVRWLGPVSDAVLAELYRQARAVVAYSLAEGFDYPTVEAMACATPLVVSDIPVHREIVGDLAHYAAPDQPEALASELLAVLAMDARQQGAYRIRALERVRAITQRGASALYRQVYRQVLDG
jgi:glycosyltransferase involved in cell wall biosynthesis